MTLRDEAAQLVFIPFRGAAPNSRSREYREFLKRVREDKVGGLVLVNWSNGRVVQRAQPYELAAFLNRMQGMARVPLMVAGDFERGASMRVESVTVFPHAMAFGAAGDPALTRWEGEVTAREARALGIHWLFYPVADVNNNPDNPIINTRSFGENPEQVAAHVKAFIEGAHSDKNNFVLVTAKHFPGHGDTAVDTHLNVATISGDREHLDKVEFVPFRAAIAAGVDSIMTAHIAVPAIAPPGLPATLSSEVLTGVLRKDFGFKGLVVTDALEMGGIAQGFTSGEAAVRAIEAGADALVMPADPDAAIAAVVAAVKSGRISRKRLQESVMRILEAKVRVGLARKRTVSLDGIEDGVNSPEDAAKADAIAERALTLVRNQPGALPLSRDSRACYAVLSEGKYSTGGQAFAQEVRKRQPKASLVTLDPTMTKAAVNEEVSKTTPCDRYVVAAFASVAAYRGSAGLAGELPSVVETMTASGLPVTFIALGNPYLLRSFPGVTAYLATFSSVPPAEVAAVAALFGEIPITGRLPVSIPGLAAYGEGIQLEAAHPRAKAVVNQN